MGKEKILRPDSGAVKTMMETATRIDATLQRICDSEDPQRRSAQEAAQRLYDERIREELEKGTFQQFREEMVPILGKRI